MKQAWIAVVMLAGLAPAAALADEAKWFRCNTHTHTGAPGPEVPTSPLDAAEWYRTHGYQCLVITDHENRSDPTRLTDISEINRQHAQGGDFLVIPGQEIGQAIANPLGPRGALFYHINGLGIGRAILPIGYPGAASGITPKEAYRQHIDAIYSAGGVPQVNHPNLHWSVKEEDLLGLTQPFLMEVWNAFPTSNNLGGADSEGRVAPSTEQLWDRLLSNGQIVWGTATDDTHDYVNFDKREETPTPGKAWIVVRSPRLTSEAILSALRRGDFHASTGVVLETLDVTADHIAIRIAPIPNWNKALSASTRLVTRFIGENGRILSEVVGNAPRYEFKGDERYVRANIVDSDGRRAWIQPVFRDARQNRSP